MYILCTESPCTKKTPHVYEMNSRNICPVCGEKATPSLFDLATKGLTRADKHILSGNADFLMQEKQLILSARALKGATT